MHSHIKFNQWSHRAGESRADVITTILVLIVFFVIAVALFLPPGPVSRPASPRNACQNNMRQIGLALHTYQDARKRYPSGCYSLKEIESGAPLLPLTRRVAGSANPDNGAKYSFLVHLLPYMEEGNIYNQIATASNRFQLPAFDPAVVYGNTSMPFAALEISTFRCPSDVHDGYSTAPEYQRFKQVNPITNQPAGIALTSYVATFATELDLVADRPAETNGVIVPEGSTTMRDIKNGLSRTIMLAETKETAYSSWYDAGDSWLVAVPPEQARTRAQFDSLVNSQTETQMVNYGPDDDHPDRAYLPRVAWSNQQPRRWGASSHHAGGAMHAFVDGGVRFIADDIDPKVYRALIDRNATREEKDMAEKGLE